MMGARVAIVGALALFVGACGSTNTKGSWSCAAETGGSCSPISVTDGSAGRGASPSSVGIDTAGPVRWWEPQPFVFAADQAARREGDQVMRIVFAPWVDAQGDLHRRSEVVAVMRRGGWWMPAPTTASASTEISRIGRNALEQ